MPCLCVRSAAGCLWPPHGHGRRSTHATERQRGQSSPGCGARDQPSDIASRPLKIVLFADTKDHGPGEHDYPRWQTRWALLLGGASASTEKAANLDGPTAGSGAGRRRGACSGRNGARVAHRGPVEKCRSGRGLLLHGVERAADCRGTQVLGKGGRAGTDPFGHVDDARANARCRRLNGCRRVRTVSSWSDHAHDQPSRSSDLPRIAAGIQLEDESYWPPTPRQTPLACRSWP